MPLPLPTSSTFPEPDTTSDYDRPATVYVEVAHLNRALARLRFAKTGERAAVEHAAALAAETDAANRDLASALSRVHDLEGQLDHLAEILAGRERYVVLLERRARIRRSLRWRLARLWRPWRRPGRARWLVAAAILLAVQVLIVLLPAVGGW